MKWLRWTAALVLVSSLFAACGDDDDDADEAEDTTEETTDDEAPSEEPEEAEDAEGEALDIAAVDFAFEGLPEEIPGGNVTVHMTNDGAVPHEIAFVNIGEESNADGFFDDFGPVIQEGAPWPDYVTNLAGANEAEPGDDFTVTYQLAPGTYMVFCALTDTVEEPPEGEEGPPHFAEGMQQLVTVTEGEASPMEGSDGTITASDYTFDVDLSSGDQLITFANEGPNDHFAGISKFPEGTTVEDAEAAMEAMLTSETGEPPAGMEPPEDLGFSGITSTGTEMQFELAAPLEPGVYSFVCFISDRAGGPPHAIGHNMVTVVEIT